MQEQTGTPLIADRVPTPARGAAQPLIWGLLVAVVAVDQGSKVWALGALDPGAVRPLIGDLITLRLIRNPGAAFSFLEGMTFLITVVALGVTLAILWAARTRAIGRLHAVGLGLIAGGAIGNLIDRIFREPGIGRGHVVDFIDYFGWFVGNVADIVIVLAAIWSGALYYRGYRLDGTREQHA